MTTGVSASAAQISAPGRSAIAVVRARASREVLDSAINRHFLAANGKRIFEQPLNQLRFGRWGDDVPEEMVLCRTSETEVELNCHGGTAAVRRVLNDLAAAEIPTVTWMEQLGQTRTTLDVEGADVVARAVTARTALLALRQPALLANAVSELVALAQASDWPRLETRLSELLRWGEFGRHLAEPWRVVIAGRPNVGKSTLLNALLGFERAIVFDEPGTTRDVLRCETAFDGWPVTLVDTAGLRETDHAIEAEGVRRARDVLAACDCACFVFDLSQPATDDDRALLEESRHLPRALIVGNKADLARQWDVAWPTEAVLISASQGTGIPALIDACVRQLVPIVPAPDVPVPLTTRQCLTLERCLDAARHRDEVHVMGELSSFIG